jgi:RNA recognition motif-containing protein
MKLFIGNLSQDTTELQIGEALADVGPIVHFHRPSDFTTGNPRGFAFVTMADREAGEKAIEVLNDLKIDGRELKVNEAEERRSSHPADRPKWVSMKVPKAQTDDRPVGPDGRKVRYKSI